MRLRRTKIVATLGPASSSEAMISNMIKSGANIFRLNFSHGSYDEQQNRINLIKKVAHAMHTEVGILVDLQGPKIRIASFKSGSVTLIPGEKFTLDANLEPESGDNLQVGIVYKQLVKEVEKGSHLVLADGLIELEVLEVIDSKIICQVLVGGLLHSKQGINKRGGGLSAAVLTSKDRKDIEFIGGKDIDFVALSFIKSADDILEAKQLLMQVGQNAAIIAKIERFEAIENLDAIIDVSDGVMVARGDLGVELGFAELPFIQKKIITKARELNKAVITATQMMESMRENPIPTRAEVFDVANAVLDGTDAVMLSAETATGKYPDKVVKSMSDICFAAESDNSLHKTDVHSDFFSQTDEAVALAAMYAANRMDIKAIIALTESGKTPLRMSRIRSGIPIYGLSSHELTCRKMTLYRGVYPILFDISDYKPWEVTPAAIDSLLEMGLVAKGDKVIVTKGDIIGVHGRSNSIKFLEC